MAASPCPNPKALSRVSYDICGADCKMKIQAALLKILLFQGSDSKAVNPVWFSSEQGAHVNHRSYKGLDLALIFLNKKTRLRNFPGGTVDKSLGCRCSRYGFCPWSGKIPHAAEQLSPHATTIEACGTRAHTVQQEKAPQ